MRQCTKCRVKRSLDQFHRRGAGCTSHCKPCRSAHASERYRADPKHARDIVRAREIRLKEWARNLKQGKPCAHCGGTFHPVATQWDQIAGGKLANVSNMRVQ